MNLFELTKELINIPSITGNEVDLADFLCSYLLRLGFIIQEQIIDERRKNILATTNSSPKVVLCTHMDTVPPFLAASEDELHIFGRGACDAKSSMAAMIMAAQKLKENGTQELALLFVVGEETDSLGAKKANSFNLGSEYIIVGEPTENKLGTGHKGLIVIKISAHGKSAHSAFPESGESAIEKLLDALQLIRNMKLAEDTYLGKSLLNIGMIHGGSAHNIIPDNAAVTLSVRNTITATAVIDQFKSILKDKVEIEILSQSEPQMLFIVPGFEQVVLPFGTDIPHLNNFGEPLLIGPGSAKVAHTDFEKIEKQQLEEAVEIYINLVQQLLSETQE